MCILYKGIPYQKNGFFTYMIWYRSTDTEKWRWNFYLHHINWQQSFKGDRSSSSIQITGKMNAYTSPEISCQHDSHRKNFWENKTQNIRWMNQINKQNGECWLNHEESMLRKIKKMQKLNWQILFSVALSLIWKGAKKCQVTRSRGFSFAWQSRYL